MFVLKGTPCSYSNAHLVPTQRHTLFLLKGTPVFLLKGTPCSFLLKGTPLLLLKRKARFLLKRKALFLLKGTPLLLLKRKALFLLKGTPEQARDASDAIQSVKRYQGRVIAYNTILARPYAVGVWVTVGL